MLNFTHTFWYICFTLKKDQYNNKMMSLNSEVVYDCQISTYLGRGQVSGMSNISCQVQAMQLAAICSATY